MRLGLLTCLIVLLRWPDWQLPALFVRGFAIAGWIQPTNIYPQITKSPDIYLWDLCWNREAEVWNCLLANNSRVLDYDEEVEKTAHTQIEADLLLGPYHKDALDAIFGSGAWRAIKRHGIWQGQLRKDGSKKIRGIDDARMSRHNAAAILTDTIATTPPDIAMQCAMWRGRCGASHDQLKAFDIIMGSDDLADAYHGVPTKPEQLCLSVVAFRSTALHRAETNFAISVGHLFGLAAAVVNFNRLPELLTAVCRRIGFCPTWHFYDDQGGLTFSLRSGVFAYPPQKWVDFVFQFVGRLVPADKTPAAPAGIGAHRAVQ